MITLATFLFVAIFIGILAQGYKARTGAAWGAMTFAAQFGLLYLMSSPGPMTPERIELAAQAGRLGMSLLDAHAIGIAIIVMAAMSLIVATLPNRAAS